MLYLVGYVHRNLKPSHWSIKFARTPITKMTKTTLRTCLKRADLFYGRRNRRSPPGGAILTLYIVMNWTCYAVLLCHLSDHMAWHLSTSTAINNPRQNPKLPKHHLLKSSAHALAFLNVTWSACEATPGKAQNMEQMLLMIQCQNKPVFI